MTIVTQVQDLIAPLIDQVSLKAKPPGYTLKHDFLLALVKADSTIVEHGEIILRDMRLQLYVFNIPGDITVFHVETWDDLHLFITLNYFTKEVNLTQVYSSKIKARVCCSMVLTSDDKYVTNANESLLREVMIEHDDAVIMTTSENLPALAEGYVGNVFYIGSNTHIGDIVAKLVDIDTDIILLGSYRTYGMMRPILDQLEIYRTAKDAVVNTVDHVDVPQSLITYDNLISTDEKLFVRKQNIYL